MLLQAAFAAETHLAEVMDLSRNAVKVVGMRRPTKSKGYAQINNIQTEERYNSSFIINIISSSLCFHCLEYISTDANKLERIHGKFLDDSFLV
jgi:hypothetical protein